MVSKTCRQLVIFHIFIYSKVIEMKEIIRLIEVSKRTIRRDLQELQSAGLLNIKFSKKENGYVHINDNSRCPFSAPIFCNNKARNIHIEKLIRLATIMIGLRYHIEVPYYEKGYNLQETCSSWYKKRYPHLSTRTMQRDFKKLSKIGYEIKYDYYDKCYTIYFPEGLEEI